MPEPLQGEVAWSVITDHATSPFAVAWTWLASPFDTNKYFTMFKFISKHLIINWFSTRNHPDSWLPWIIPTRMVRLVSIKSKQAIWAVVIVCPLFLEEINRFLLHSHHWYFVYLIHRVFDYTLCLWYIVYLLHCVFDTLRNCHIAYLIHCVFDTYCVFDTSCICYIAYLIHCVIVTSCVFEESHLIVLQPWVELWDGHLDTWRGSRC